MSGLRGRLPAVILAIAASAATLAYLVAGGPFREQVAIVMAGLLPAGLILLGADAIRRRRALREQTILASSADERRRDAVTGLQHRLAELMTLNELGVGLASTLDIDELLDRSLETLVRHLRFDRALILLADEERGVLGGGRSIGGTAEMTAAVAALELPLDLTESQLVQLYGASGPLLFQDASNDRFEPNRRFAAMLEADSFLGTPLVAKTRTVGVLAVDNRMSGREVDPSDGPLLYTVGNLVAAAVENARLYTEVEAQKAELERRVAQRTEALAAAIEEAQAARATAEAASATKSQFLSNVSHELRTPLTSVIGFTKLVRRRLDEVILPALPADVVDDPKIARATRQVSENLEIMAAEGDRLTTLINDVLDLAKIEAGRLEWRSGPVEIGELIGRATAATASLFEQSGLRLVTEVAPDLPAISGDRDRLIQVVINLLSNAVKFTPVPGTITVRAAITEQERGAIVVSVADTGIGIAPGDQATVWEQFGQAGDTLTDKPRGTGLGLPICREIVEHHGGRIWLESEPGHGSTFLFTLPLPPPGSGPVAA